MSKKVFDMVILAPHLDDAILSAGEHLLEWKKEGKKILIVTVFTKHFGKNKLPDYTKKFLEICGFENGESFGEERLREDKKAMKKLGVNWEHWGIVDAGFRKNKNKIIYPTKEKLLSGKIDAADNELIVLLMEKIKKINGNLFIFPSGIGGHVDHLILRKVGERVKKKKYLYLDAPYLWEKNNIINCLLRFYKIKSFRFGSKQKDGLLKCYKSQYCLWPKRCFTYPDVLVESSFKV